MWKSGTGLPFRSIEILHFTKLWWALKFSFWHIYPHISPYSFSYHRISSYKVHNISTKLYDLWYIDVHVVKVLFITWDLVLASHAELRHVASVCTCFFLFKNFNLFQRTIAMGLVFYATKTPAHLVWPPPVSSQHQLYQVGPKTRRQL